jgi:hypothetical protein
MIEQLEAIQQAPNFLLAAMSAPEEKESRVRDVVFYTGAKVSRTDWWTGESYDLSFDMESADLSELQARGRVLNGHSQYSALDVLGSVENPRRADIGYVATLRFTEAEDIEPIWQRIVDGSIRDVSMGVKIGKLTLVEENKKNGRKHYMASNWTPYEISVVPFGADAGARFLAADPRLEKLRAIEFSAPSGSPTTADEGELKARQVLALKARRWRVLGR